MNKQDMKNTIEIITSKIKNYMESMLIEAISFTQPIVEPQERVLNLQV